MEPNQTPVQPSVEPTPETQNLASQGDALQNQSKKSLPKLPLIIAAVILVAILLIGIYMLSKNQSVNQKPAQKTTQIPAPTKTTNALNPNTGNLYSDIKVRLNEVLK